MSSTRLADFVRETTTTTGTGAVDLDGATSPFRTFLSTIGATNQCLYTIQDDDDFETGIGTVNAGTPPTLSRNTVLESSNGDAAVSWPAGTRNVFVAMPSKVLPMLDETSIFTADQEIRSSDGGSGSGPFIVLDRDSPSPAVNDLIGGIKFRGNDAAVATFLYAMILVQILDLTAASEDSQLLLQTTVAGALATRGRIHDGLVMGAATSGDKGPGTGNFVAAYDDGVILTPYPLEAELTGSIDLQAMDDGVPDFVEPEVVERVDTGVLDEFGRRIMEERVTTPEQRTVREHLPARRLAENMDELDLANYAAKWRASGHLPALPSRAQWIAAKGKIPMGRLVQSLMEEISKQAIHDAQLHERLTALETAAPPDPGP